MSIDQVLVMYIIDNNFIYLFFLWKAIDNKI